MSAQRDSASSSRVSFADVAHQTLTFDSQEPAEQLVLKLIDTRWMQRLRRISQTGNTRFVYMFAEHSRFGHCLGVAYLAVLLMKHLRAQAPDLVQPYEAAVAAAALLHDIGHVAPGSHLAERIWAPDHGGQHEQVSVRVLQEDPELRGILDAFDPGLCSLVCRILDEDPELPAWTTAIISGGGWNADRGNWAIVDSAMCAVTYGRYNVAALVEAFRLSERGELVIQESRVDALTHFFVARDSMYRQIYQHRVLQAVDSLTRLIVVRLRDLCFPEGRSNGAVSSLAEASKVVTKTLGELNTFCDDAMANTIAASNYAVELPLAAIFSMTEQWWGYHIERWCDSHDRVLSDLALRMRDRRLFKTVRLSDVEAHDFEANAALVERAESIALKQGLDPRYYITPVEDADAHRGKSELPPMVLLDGGKIVPVTDVEPLIAQLMARPAKKRRWIAMPKSIKDELGRSR